MPITTRVSLLRETPGAFETATVELDDPRQGELTVKLAATGLCHSDDHILKGDMSLVGPRPNVKRETDLYTPAEKKLLSVKPGVTDFASIVFADEGDILKDQADPDLAYNQLIRPYKSRLGLLYVENASLVLDIKLVILTAVAIIDRESALDALQNILRELKADPDLIRVAARKDPLQPAPPPGADAIVTTRDAKAA